MAALSILKIFQTTAISCTIKRWRIQTRMEHLRILEEGLASHISALSSQRNRWLGPFLRHFVHFICCFQPEACVKCALLSFLDSITIVKWKDFILDLNSFEIVYWSRASSQIKSILVSQIADLPHGASWRTETFHVMLLMTLQNNKFSVWNGLKSGFSTFPSWVELWVWSWQESRKRGMTE